MILHGGFVKFKAITFIHTGFYTLDFIPNWSCAAPLGQWHLRAKELKLFELKCKLLQAEFSVLTPEAELNVNLHTDLLQTLEPITSLLSQKTAEILREEMWAV